MRSIKKGRASVKTILLWWVVLVGAYWLFQGSYCGNFSQLYIFAHNRIYVFINYTQIRFEGRQVFTHSTAKVETQKRK